MQKTITTITPVLQTTTSPTARIPCRASLIVEACQSAQSIIPLALAMSLGAAIGHVMLRKLGTEAQHLKVYVSHSTAWAKKKKAGNAKSHASDGGIPW